MRRLLLAGAATVVVAAALVAALVVMVLGPAVVGLGKASGGDQGGKVCPGVIAADGVSPIVGTIVTVGAQLGVSARGQMIALAVGLVESGLRNVDHGDRDSLGVFQQRPSQGWGTPAQVQDVAFASTSFYTRLLAIPGWQNLEPGSVAQMIQRSAFPSRYSDRMSEAAGLLAGAGPAAAPCVDTVAAAGGFTDGTGMQAIPRANPRTVEEAIAWARAQAASGANGWFRLCLSFVAQSYGWAYSGTPLAIDEFTAVPEQYRHPGDRNPPPGALMFWRTGSPAGHIALAVGGGMIASNDVLVNGQISIVPVGFIESRWGAHYVGWSEPYWPKAG